MAIAPSAADSAASSLLASLDPEQRAAAMLPNGPAQVIAPAGSGKTTTLIARLGVLLERGVAPDRIGVVTFNRDAAAELSERIARRLAPHAPGAEAIEVRTLHAMARQVLIDAGRPVRLVADRLPLLRAARRRALAEMPPPREGDEPPLEPPDPGALDMIVSAWKVEGRSPPPNSWRAVGAFADLMATRGLIDFDDLVVGAVAALEAEPQLRSRWQSRFLHVCVDEFQDVDAAQLRLVRLLAAPEDNLFVVGDDDQTIYAWRLADVRRILDLASRLPGLRRVDLVTNYRCPKPVVDRAVRLIENNRERFAKAIRAGPSAAGELLLYPDPGDWVARARSLMRTWVGHAPGAHAVLARTNAELSPFAAVAIEMNIPYQSADDGLLLDERTIDGLLDGLPDAGPPAIWLARRAADDPLAAVLAAWAVPHRTATQLRDAVAEARQRRRELRRDDAGLVLATAHGTKGLEFDHVCCIGMDDGTFPSRRTLDESEDPVRALEEERRLAYVAWTRARRSLLLVYDPAAPSVLMREAFSDQELSPLPR